MCGVGPPGTGGGRGEPAGGWVGVEWARPGMGREWSGPVGDLHVGLMRDLEDLANSGQQWARRAIDAKTSHGHLYISAADFTDHFRERAERDDRIQLITLDDCVGGSV